MLIQISLIPQYITLLNCHALFWTLTFNWELAAHPNGSQDLVLGYMLVTPHLIQDWLHSFVIQERDMYHHNFMWYLMTTSQRFCLWRKNEVPPHWAKLIENSREKVTEKHYELAKTWLFPDAEPGDIFMPERNQNIYNNSNGIYIDREMISHNVSQNLLSTDPQSPIHVGLSDYSEATGISQNGD